MFTPRDLKNETVAFFGEFIGTFFFLFMGFAGAQTVNHAAALKATPETAKLPNLGNLMFISVIFSLSLMVNAWIFFRISGGMFNPVVTMSLFIVRAVPLLRAIIVVGAQIGAGITAAAVVKYLIPNGREVNFTVSLGDGTSVARGLFLEMLFTAELIFTILMLAVEKSKFTFMAPVGIGLALFIAHMGGVFFTGAALNPARAFGSAVISGKFPSYHWIYWLGPVMGGLLAVALYKLIKLLRYEDTNGNADKADYEPESFESFLARNGKRASALLDATTRRTGALFDKHASRGSTLYERRNGGRKRGSPVLTGGDLPMRRRTSPPMREHSPPRHSSPRILPEYPRQRYTPTASRAPSRLSRPPVGSRYASRPSTAEKKYPTTTIYSTASSDFHIPPPVPPLPVPPYYDVPIGLGPRGYAQDYQIQQRETTWPQPDDFPSPPGPMSGRPIPLETYGSAKFGRGREIAVS